MQVNISDIMRRHDTLGELCCLWEASRGTAPMPTLPAMLTAMKAVDFDNYFLLGGPQGEYVIKESGAGFVTASGFDATGARYLDRLPEPARDAADKLYIACFKQPCGMWGDYIATWPKRGRVTVTGLGLPLCDPESDNLHFIANVIPRPRRGIPVDTNATTLITKMDMDPLDTGFGVPW